MIKASLFAERTPLCSVQWNDIRDGAVYDSGGGVRAWTGGLAVSVAVSEAAGGHQTAAASAAAAPAAVGGP